MPPRVSDPSYLSHGFQRFVDRLTRHGLEMLGLYYGVYRAKVVSNDDANNGGRISIRCPAVGDGPTVSRLAYPIVPAATPNSGFKDIPPVDSYVWVKFENGRVDMPVWIGGWWANDELPEGLRDVKQRFWLTPEGHGIIFDGRDGQKKVTLKHSSGASIEIDNDGNIDIKEAASKLVRVGSGAQQFSLKGETLRDLLNDLLIAIQALTVPTPAGASGPPTNAAQFVQIQGRLQQILSTSVKSK